MITPIIILCLLAMPLLLALLISRIKGSQLNTGKYACWGLGLVFIFFFVGHFAKTESMVQMLPEWTPFRYAVVYLTGIFELLIGIALFFPKYQLRAAEVAIVVFIFFFPVNVYAALNGVGLGGHQWGPVYLLVRAPLQVILIAWAYYLCIKKLP